MEYYKPIKFYLSRKMIDLSEDQIKRRIKELVKNNQIEGVAYKKLIGRCYTWCINYYQLDHFKRIRKKKCGDNIKLLPIKKSVENKYLDYKYEVTINPKSGIVGKNIAESYDFAYYSELADSIYRIVRANMFYVIEIDDLGYKHIHFGIDSDKTTIKIAVDFVLKMIYCFDENYLIQENVAHIADIRNLYAYYNYFGDEVGNISPTYIYKEENYYE